MTKLAVADNLLDNLKSNEAFPIIQPILEEFEGVYSGIMTDINQIQVGYNAYKLMSMYYRITHNYKESIEFLNKAQKLLQNHHNNFISETGGFINYEYALNDIMQASCYDCWGSEFFIGKMTADDALKKFEEAQRKAYSALLKYLDIPSNNQQLHLSELYIIIASSLACTMKIKNETKQSLATMVLDNLQRADECLDKVTDQNNIMKVCELRIEEALACKSLKDTKKYVSYMALAESNDYWNECSTFLQVPCTQTYYVVSQDGYSIEPKDLTWNEATKLGGDDDYIYI